MATEFRGVDIDTRLRRVIRHMDTVVDYIGTLQSLQAVWDNLALLGELSGTGTEMTGTRQAFHDLTRSLVNQLGAEALKKTVLGMTSTAQVAIDILVRNLFERTADVGLLATDEDIRTFLVAASAANSMGPAALPAHRNRLQRRFAEYVAKYSVYSDIVLLDTEGTIMARLDETVSVARSQDPLVARTLGMDRGCVESYGVCDIFPDKGPALIYAHRVTTDTGIPLGVLCLHFRFKNETDLIFDKLTSPDDWSIVTLMDAGGRIISSSDPIHMPIGAALPLVTDGEFRILRFGPQEYIAVTRASQGYQGYGGPGWYGHVMLPVQYAFSRDSTAILDDVNPHIIDTITRTSTLFGTALRRIPQQAKRIQQDLNRSVWNGSIRQTRSAIGQNTTFSRILLSEISNTGIRTKSVFESSIDNLHATVVSTLLDDSEFQAALAIDIMDRNLYERANDCRWWALTSAFRDLLNRPPLGTDALNRITRILEYINRLYTVYTNILVFDRNGVVIAVSNPAETLAIGSTVDSAWFGKVLSLPTSQGYAVSAFTATPLYGNKHTYLYGAAIRTPDLRGIVGGVALVFDSTPQFSAMLRDAMPRDEAGTIQPGSLGFFVEPDGRVISCSNETYAPGDILSIDGSFLTLAPGSSRAGIVRLADGYYAAGARASSGYREFKGGADGYRNDVIAIILVKLCDAGSAQSGHSTGRPALKSDRGVAGDIVEIATFMIGRGWYGLDPTHIVEAVAATGITPMPNASLEFKGYMMYQREPVPIFDVRSYLHEDETRAASITDEPQVIILRRDEQTHVGLLVDDLGEISELAIARLRPIPATLAGFNMPAEAIVAPDGMTSDGMLVILSMERLIDRLLPEARRSLSTLQHSSSRDFN